MKNNVTFDQIKTNLAQIFSDKKLFAEYIDNGSHTPKYSMFGGWCGSMSPVNRAAYMKEFGEMVLTAAEDEGRRLAMADTGENFAKYTEEATKAGTSAPAAPGSFVFCICTGLKCDDGRGIYGEIESAATDEEYIKGRPRQLCKVEKIFEVSAEDFNDPNLSDRLVSSAMAAGQEFPGGSATDDPAPRFGFEYRFYYTVGAAVVCRDLGKWFLIDSEGFNYARYCLMPTNWREMYADQVREAIKAKEAREAEEAREVEEAREARRADYEARAAKWAPLMVDLTELVKAEAAAEYATKESKSAARKLNDARRKNIIAMIRAAWPGLKFSLHKNNSWGASYIIDYSDGPTVDEFADAVDLDLFAAASDEFDGMQDLAYKSYREFTDFARKYMGLPYGGDIEINRSQTPENQKNMLAQYAATLPDLPADLEAWRDRHNYTGEEVKKLASVWNCDEEKLYREIGREALPLNQVILAAFTITNFFTEAPAAEAAPATVEAAPVTETMPAATAQDCDEPAPGLALADIPGGVAVVGDSRTTYENRKAIKAHGATWNKAAKQWQGLTAEAVESLRAWFRTRRTWPPITPTPDQDEPTTTDTNPTPAPRQEVPTAAAMASDILDALRTVPAAWDADELRIMANGVILSNDPADAETLADSAARFAGRMLRRSATVRAGSLEMWQNISTDNPEEKRQLEKITDDFDEFADQLAAAAVAIGRALGLNEAQIDQLANLDDPQEVADPAQLELNFDNVTPAPAAGVTDAEVMATAARIRSIFNSITAAHQESAPATDATTAAETAPEAAEAAPATDTTTAPAETATEAAEAAPATDTTTAPAETATEAAEAAPDAEKLLKLFEQNINRIVYTGGDLTREDARNFKKGYFYCNGEVNTLFLAFRNGYTVANAI